MKRFYVHCSPEINVLSKSVGNLSGPSFQFQSADNAEIEIGDEYHTIHELYEHRMALSVLLFKMMYRLDLDYRGIELANNSPLVVKSKLHNDGTMFEGDYFVVSSNTSEGQISYHYKLKHWDKFNIPEIERVPWEYDGHTSKDVIQRLMKL